MRDIAIDRWADILVNYSLEAKPRQKAVIVADPVTMPLVDACIEKFLQAKAHVECLFMPAHLNEILYKNADDDELKTPPELLIYAAKNFDMYVSIDGSNNTKALARTDPKKQALVSKAAEGRLHAILNRAAKNECRWVKTQFPTASAAQDCDMGLLEYEKFIFEACHLLDDNPIKYWHHLEKEQQALIEFLTPVKELRFVNNEGTDLLVNVEGMHWVNCCGKFNFPDGEVFTGPNLKAKDGGVNGVVRYTFPSVLRHVEVQDVELVFEKGAVVQAKASKNEEFLKQMIHQDEGGKFVGEVAIGTNFQIPFGTKNILFDEKIGGTFHTAIGMGYPETGNTNKSALHWDLVCDLKKSGKIFADGVLFFEKGRFLNEKFPKA